MMPGADSVAERQVNDRILQLAFKGTLLPAPVGAR
jgi:hypothetical protein